MIDRIRHDIQQRLDQLLAEADKLHRALAALDPRQRSAPEPKPTRSRPATKPTAETPTVARNDAGANRKARYWRDKRRQRVAANSTRSDQGDGPGRARGRPGVDRRRGRDGDGARATDRQHHVVTARQGRRRRQG